MSNSVHFLQFFNIFWDLRSRVPAFFYALSKTFSGVNNMTNVLRLGSRWRDILWWLEHMTNSALVKFLDLHSSKRQQDPNVQTIAIGRTHSPKAKSSEKKLGPLWRIEKMKVKGQNFPSWAYFAPQ